jgi:hypothetical protein
MTTPTQNLSLAACEGELQKIDDLVNIDEVPVDSALDLNNLHPDLSTNFIENLNFFGIQAVWFLTDNKYHLHNVNVKCNFDITTLFVLLVNMLYGIKNESNEAYVQRIAKQQQAFNRLLELGADCNLSLNFTINYKNQGHASYESKININIADMLLLAKNFHILEFLLANPIIRAKLIIPSSRTRIDNLYISRQGAYKSGCFGQEPNRESRYYTDKGTSLYYANCFELGHTLSIARYSAYDRNGDFIGQGSMVLMPEVVKKLKIALFGFAAATLNLGLARVPLTKIMDSDAEFFAYLFATARNAGKSEEEIRKWIVQSGMLSGSMQRKEPGVLAELLKVLSKEDIQLVINDKNLVVDGLFSVRQFGSNYITDKKEALQCFQLILAAAVAQQLNIDALILWCTWIPRESGDFAVLCLKEALDKGANPETKLVHNSRSITYAEYWLRTNKTSELEIWLKNYPAQFAGSFFYKQNPITNAETQEQIEQPDLELSAVGLLLKAQPQGNVYETSEALRLLLEYGITPKIEDFVFCLNMLGGDQQAKENAMQYLFHMQKHADLSGKHEGCTLYELAVDAKQTGLINAITAQLAKQSASDLESKYHIYRLLEIAINKNQTSSLEAIVKMPGVKPQPRHLAQCLAMTPCNRDIYTLLIKECGIDVNDPEVIQALATKGHEALSKHIASLGLEYIAEQQRKKQELEAAERTRQEELRQAAATAQTTADLPSNGTTNMASGSARRKTLLPLLLSGLDCCTKLGEVSHPTEAAFANATAGVRPQHKT